MVLFFYFHYPIKSLSYCNLLLRAKITFYLFLIILIIQIVPLFISYLLSIKLYKGILPTSIIMENNYLKNLLKKGFFFLYFKRITRRVGL